MAKKAFLIASALASLSATMVVSAQPVVNSRQLALDPKAKIINISASTQVFYKGDPLKFTVLRANAGTCAQVKVTLNGVSRTENNATFPWTFDISPGHAMYPKTSAKYEVTVEGTSGCHGSVTYTFAFNASDKGKVDDLVITGWDNPDTAAVKVMGHGMCTFRIATWKAPYAPNGTPYDLVFYYEPVKLPATVPLKRSAQVTAQWGGDHIVEIIPLSMNNDGTPNDATKKKFPSYEGCSFAQPPATSPWLMRKQFTAQKAASATNGGSSGSGSGSGSGGAPGGGGGGLPSSPKPATGKIVSMLVPGGSFAEDEAQKIQVNGQGGCAMDLMLSNKASGGSYEQTFPVQPMKLDGGAMLYNGTHFGTLAEGSWNATATGKNGCTGNAAIAFKVTPKTSTKKVTGKPTVSFDQQPKAGGNTFTVSKDSNIWFKVAVPQSVKDEPYATCCDVEFDFINEYGGWEALPNSPFSDSSWGLAVKQANAVVPKSVSGFTQGTQWRVKMRASKFKTEFEWSDWLEFKVGP